MPIQEEKKYPNTLEVTIISENISMEKLPGG
jgi:hypothetical protein